MCHQCLSRPYFHSTPNKLLHSDELARNLEDDLNKVYGHNFNLGGLSGFPFAGNTGFGAMSSHVPDDGFCLLGTMRRPEPDEQREEEEEGETLEDTETIEAESSDSERRGRKRTEPEVLSEENNGRTYGLLSMTITVPKIRIKTCITF